MPAGALTSLDDFASPQHVAVYEAMIKVLERCEPLDMHTLYAELECTGRLRLIGGLSELDDIVGHGGTHTIEHYARVVRDASKRRALARACRRLQEAVELSEDASVLDREMVALQGAYNAWDDTRRK